MFADVPGTAMPPATAGRVIVGTALAYAVVGWLSLLLALPPGYASPLYPSAGIALAAVITYGRIAMPGVLLGSFLVNVVLSASRGQLDAPALLLPAVIGAGAALQAALGATLVHRFVAQPLLLAAPREILRAGLLGGLLACTLSPTVATAALLWSGAIGSEQVAITWGTWWVGDGLGALIGAPLALTLIGQRRRAELRCWPHRRPAARGGRARASEAALRDSEGSCAASSTTRRSASVRSTWPAA